MDITLEGLLVGLFALAIGLAFAFYGFKIFLVLLPIWGFFVGFVFGAGAMNALFPDAGFLVQVTGWVVGFLVGLVFAVLSYLYYWVAVILLGGALGYQLTLGVFHWLGFEGESLLIFLLALTVGAIFAVGFFLLHMPAVIVIVASAISGAGAAIAGVAIGLGLVPLESLEQGVFAAYEVHDLGWLGLIGGVVVAVAGIIYQARTTKDMSRAITADSYRNPGVEMGSGGGAAAA